MSPNILYFGRYYSHLSTKTPKATDRNWVRLSIEILDGWQETIGQTAYRTDGLLIMVVRSVITYRDSMLLM